MRTSVVQWRLPNPRWSCALSEPTGNVTLLFDNVHVSTDPDSFTKLLKDEPGPIKTFCASSLDVLSGHWTSFHTEIPSGLWYVVPAKADLVQFRPGARGVPTSSSAPSFMRSMLPKLKGQAPVHCFTFYSFVAF